jgi:hypothetical protein
METKDNTKTRLLLALWELGAAKQEVKKGEFTKLFVAKGKKVADYQSVFEELVEQEAIAISRTGYTLTSPKGLEVLSDGLKDPDFEFEGTIVGTWAANALVKWIRQINSGDESNSKPVNEVKNDIESYEEFQAVTLEVYDKLNHNHNLEDLVPIYRIRREIGDRISREHFNEWLLEMQTSDVLQLQGGSLPDSDPMKIEDSITTKGSGLLCYVKRLKS